MNTELLIGTRDWEHPGWSGRFYPDDLPPEWRLGYYANEFRTVLVPAERWWTASEAELESWITDTPDEFRFVLELPAEPQAARLDTVTEALGPRLGACLALNPFEFPGYPIVAANALWQPDTTGFGPWSIGLITSAQEPHTPRALRTLLEAFLAHAAGSQSYLFFTGTPPLPADATTAATIAQLLGA